MVEEIQFGIQIEDENYLRMDDFTVIENQKFASLFDWQRRAIDFFFDNKGIAIFQCCTGCITGDTLIDMPRDLIKYPKGIPIKELVGKKNFYTYSMNNKNNMLELSKVLNVWLSKKNVDVYEVTTRFGKKIQTTINHPFLVNIVDKENRNAGGRPLLIKREFKPLSDIKVGDYVTIFNRSEKHSKEGEYIRTYFPFLCKDNKRKVLEHRFIMKQFNKILSSWDVVHHIDENRFNNNINNLENMDIFNHSSYHTKKNGFYGKMLWEQNGHPKGMLGKYHFLKGKKIKINEFDMYGFNSQLFKGNNNQAIAKFKLTMSNKNREEKSLQSDKNFHQWSVQRIVNIKYIGKKDVYDMEVEKNHNFIGNGFFIHNSGKTRFAIELIKQIWETEPFKRVLIVVPKNIILESTWQKELYENGISLKDIGLYYGDCKEYGKVTVTNMQNLHNIAMDIFTGGIIIFDECHNYGTERLLPYMNGDFKYKIGLSATLERMDEKHYEIIKIFNYNVFNYNPEEALNDGILNAFKFINIGVEMDAESFEKYTLLTDEINQLLTMGGGFRRIMAMGETALKNKMLGLIGKRKELVNNYYRKFEALTDIAKNHFNDKVLAFNEFNTQTTKCYWYLLEIGIKAKIIHSGIPQIEREKVLQEFKKDKFNFLLATRILDEGYNLPKIDTAIIMSGNSTSRQTIQRMGRVLRKKKKESTLYQIYCKNTIEEIYAEKRAKIFRELCSSYDEKLI